MTEYNCTIMSEISDYNKAKFVKVSDSYFNIIN